MKDMRDMRVKDLLRLAAQGVVPPGDAEVDDVFARADRIRRRRRIAIAAGSAAAVVAVGVGTAFLPEPSAAPGTGYAASAPPSVPGAATEPAPSTGTTLSTTTGTTATPELTRSAAPVDSSPTASATTTAPRTTAPTSGSKSSASGTATGTTTRSPSSSATAPAKSPAQIVAALLGSGAGTVRKESSADATAGSANALSGRYLVTKDGKTGYLDVVVYDPAATPGQTGRTVAQETAYNYCADNGTDPPNTDCATTPQDDGSVLKSWTVPGGRQKSGSQDVYGKAYGASFTYPDGRGVRVTASAGISGSNPYGPPMTEPPVSKTALAELVGKTGWFKS